MPNIDRRDDEMPTQSMAMRFISPYPRKSAYAKPDNFKPAPTTRPLKGDQDQLPENLQKAIKDAPPLKRGVGGKSIRDRIKEDADKKKAKDKEESIWKSMYAPSSPPPAPASKKAPTKRFCGGMSKPYKRK